MVKINLEEITNATYAWLRKNERRIVISTCLVAVAALGLISCGAKKITLAEAQATVDAQRTTDASGCAADQGVIAQDLGNQLTASHAEATNGVEDLQTQVVSLQGTLGAPTLTPNPSDTPPPTVAATPTIRGWWCGVVRPSTSTSTVTFILEASITPSLTPTPEPTLPPGGGDTPEPEPSREPRPTREKPTDIPTQPAA